MKSLRIIKIVVRLLFNAATLLTYSIFSVILFYHAMEILDEIKVEEILTWQVDIVAWAMIIVITCWGILLLYKMPTGIDTKERDKKLLDKFIEDTKRK